MILSVTLAGREGLGFAQEQVGLHHYLHKPVDVRARLVAYLVMLHEKAVGCLIYGRPESTRVNGWYGSVQDVATLKSHLTRWQVINLARVWLHESIQRDGEYFVENAATWAIAQTLRRVVFDYLLLWPPVWMDEPYELRECLSYCDTCIHHGSLYRAANFRLVRRNDAGIEKPILVACAGLHTLKRH